MKFLPLNFILFIGMVLVQLHWIEIAEANNGALHSIDPPVKVLNFAKKNNCEAMPNSRINAYDRFWVIDKKNSANVMFCKSGEKEETVFYLLVDARPSSPFSGCPQKILWGKDAPGGIAFSKSVEGDLDKFKEMQTSKALDTKKKSIGPIIEANFEGKESLSRFYFCSEKKWFVKEHLDD